MRNRGAVGVALRVVPTTITKLASAANCQKRRDQLAKNLDNLINTTLRSSLLQLESAYYVLRSHSLAIVPTSLDDNIKS